MFFVRLLSRAFALAAAILTAIPASAATIEQIVAMTKSGVSEPVILALIDRDATIFPLDADQIVRLKRDGVSDTVVMAMLKSGREAGDAAAQAASDANAEAILSSLSTAPSVLIVGHGPDRADSPQTYDGVAYAPYAYGAVPYAVLVGPGGRARRARRIAVPPPQGSALPPVVPPTGLPMPPVPSATGIFFNDGGGAARGIFFPPEHR